MSRPKKLNIDSDKHQFVIDSLVDTTDSGVYKIIIGDYYYYGSASNLRKRIMAHLSAFRTENGLKGGRWPIVKNYSGVIKMELIALVDDYKERLTMETALQNKKDEFCLNYSFAISNRTLHRW